MRELNSLILQVINEIRTCYGHHRAVRIFPAINNALAVATGSASAFSENLATKDEVTEVLKKVIIE